MADWGLLAGLGEGLTNFGNKWSADAKEVVREKLAQEREARAEQRELAKEERTVAREANTVAGYRPEIDGSGVLWIQGHNRAGDARGEKRLANQTELQQYKMEQDKQKLSLEDLTSRAAVNKFKAGRLETEAAQDDQAAQARLGLIGAQTAAANARASNPGGGRSSRTSLEKEAGPVATSDLVTALVDEEKALFDEYDIPRSERLMLAKSVIREASSNGKDPVDALRQSLPHYIKLRAPAKKKSSLID